MEILLINFSWTKQTFNNQPTMCFSMNEKWFLLSKSLGLAETKDILPGNPLYKDWKSMRLLIIKEEKNKQQETICISLIIQYCDQEVLGIFTTRRKEICVFLGSNLFPQRGKCSISLTWSFPQNISTEFYLGKGKN